MRCAFVDLKRVGCSDHYLNKILEKTFTDEKQLELEEAQKLFSLVKEIIEHVRRAHRQNKLSKKLQICSKTRFNGAFIMFYVFNEIFQEIPQTLNANHLLSYSLIDKHLLHQLCDFLIHFDVVIQKLSDEQRPTIHLVVPLRQYLTNCCVVHDDDENGLISIKKGGGRIRGENGPCWNSTLSFPFHHFWWQNSISIEIKQSDSFNIVHD